MSVFDTQAAASVSALYGHFGDRVDITDPGSGLVMVSVLVDINPSAAVNDERGIFIESRCEIGLYISEAGEGERGYIIDAGEALGEWRLTGFIEKNQWESRWTAVPV